MSVNSRSLKNPILIGALVLGGIAVTILNIQTFGPKKRPGRRVQTAVMDQPALPPDLAMLVQEAMAASTADPASTTGLSKILPRLNRDPFAQPRRQMAASSSGSGSQSAKSVKKKGFVCSAIMIGGKQPSARINGKFYSPGDRIGSYTVAWIASNGVTLQIGSGAKKFLPLTNYSRQSGALQVKVQRKSETG